MIPGPIRRSTVDIGRAFELHSLSFLTRHFYMDLVQVGGANDGGVDLRGWWDVPSTSSGRGKRKSFSSQRLRVIGQCKAESKVLGPKTVRELEGVMSQLRDESPSIAILLSQSGFSPGAMTHATRSPTPLLLLHLPLAQSRSSEPDGIVEGAFWNAALSQGILGGQLELRREILLNSGQHEITGETQVKTRIGLWYQGQPFIGINPS